jgi:hypothetical protein
MSKDNASVEFSTSYSEYEECVFYEIKIDSFCMCVDNDMMHCFP